MGTLNVVDPSGHNKVQSDTPRPFLVSSKSAACPSVLTASGQLQTASYFSWASLEGILPAWQRILNENQTLSIFSTPEWLRSWWEAFGRNRRLVVLAFLDSRGNVVGIVPMSWGSAKHPVFGRLKELRLLGDGSGDSDNLDLIIQPGYEEACVSAFLNWIAEQRNCGICSFNTLPANSLARKLLISKLQAASWPMRLTTTPNSLVPFPSSWESYAEGLSPKFRRLITRSRRRADGQFQVRLRRCAHEQEIPEMLETLYVLHQKRWTSANEPGSFRSSERRHLYARMAKAFFDRGWLELWTLELNDRPVAAQMSFRYRDHVYGLQEGFDTDFYSHHVGHVLRAGMFEQFIQTGATSYDFLGGFNAQKQRWGAQRGEYTNLQFAIPHSLASCFLQMDKRAAESKEWLRQHLPSLAWSILHRVKLALNPAEREKNARDMEALEDLEGSAQGAAIR
jgi:CelD/BcsL family acetyltransferase involved in cellulose biosynthesis